MAGLGSRFTQAGFDLPKPLISVADKEMYRHAVDCLPLHLCTKLIFIIRKSDFLSAIIKSINCHYSNRYPCVLIILDEETKGQAETVLKSASYLNIMQPTLVHNCDTFISPILPWESIMRDSCQGAMVLFQSQETRWSYAALDTTGFKIVEVKEKKVISNQASSGTYYFKNTCSLLKDIQMLIDNGLTENNEYYLSTVYQLMIRRGDIIKPIETRELLCFGTPQDLVISLNAMLTT